MIRRWVMWLLLVQGVAALALAGWLFRVWRPALLAALPPLHGLVALAAGVGAVLALRLLISLNNFHLSYYFSSPTPPGHRLSAGRALRLVLGEFLSSLRTTSLDMLYPIGLQLPPNPQGLPVLLIHGYGCNSGFWRPLSARLNLAGVSHLGIDLEPPGADIDTLAEQAAAGVERLCAATGSARVIMVGHSMGGLVARAYLRRFGAARVAQVITLGSPHGGTALARFGLGRNAAQMRHGSDWLLALARAEANLQRPVFTSIYSVHDNIVAPQNSSHFSEARNLILGGIGHVALGRHPDVMTAVLDEVGQTSAGLDKTWAQA